MSKVMKTFVCRGCLNPVTSTGCTSVDIDASMEYEVEGARPRSRPKKTWREIGREIVEKECQAHKLNREDALDRNR